MKTARTLVLSFACLLLASNVLAQMQSAKVQSAEERYVWPQGLPRPVPHSTMHSTGLDFTITRDTDWQDESDGVQHTFYLSIQNLTSDTLHINAVRTQQLPGGWVSSICDPNQCHSIADSSVPWAIVSKGTAKFSLNLTPVLDDKPDSGTVWLRISGESSSDTILLPFYGTYLPANPPLIFQWAGNPTFDQTFHGTGTWTIKDFLENHAGRGTNYLLSLQASLPTGWSLTFDLERNQYSSTGDLGDTILNLAAPVGTASLITNFSAIYDSTSQQPITFSLNAPTVTKEDSAVIYLSVHPQTGNPADSANYQFVMIVQPQSSVASNSDERAGLAVTNAWPNPLYSSGALHLEIMTDQAGPAKAVIYDVTGTEKGSVDLGMLQEGTNALQVSPPSLPSGEYIVRVAQGTSASEAVRLNFVK